MDDQEPPFSPDLPPENPPEPETPQHTTQTFSNDNASSPFYNHQNHSHATKMENFKALFFKFAVASSPTKSLSPMQRSIIEHRLQEFFPDFHTPDHPPYAAMIENAIGKLNEEGGSTEVAISQFIRNENPDLPRAHDIILKHHLQNLCKDGGVVKAGNRFYMLSDVVTDNNPGQLFMFSHVATHSPIACPTSDVGDESSPSSSPSWCSSTSYSSFPSPKRKRSYTRRQKRGREKGRGRQHKRTTKRKRIHLKRAGRKRRRPCKKDVVEEETELMLEEEVKESEQQTPRKEEHNEVTEGHNQVRREGRNIKELSQRQISRIVIDTVLEEFKGIVNEEWRGQQPQEKSVSRGNNQVEVVDKQNQGQAQFKVISECELQQEAEVVEARQEDHLRDGQKEVTPQEDAAKEEHQLIAEGSFLKETKFEVIQKGASVPGRRRRGRPRKKDLVEETQTNAEKLEATETQDLILAENTKVTEEISEINKQEIMVIEEKTQLKTDGTFECSQAKETQKAIEIGNPAVAAEENKSELHSLVLEEEPQMIGGSGICDEQQKHGHILEKESHETGEQKNEVSEQQNKPQRQPNQKQKMQVEKNIEYISQQKVEVAEMHNQNHQVQQKINLEGEDEKMTKRSLVIDDAERHIRSKATILPTESSSPILEEKESISKKNTEWKKESHGEVENTKLCSKLTQQKPDFPTSETSSKLVSVEKSSPTQFLQQPDPLFEEEKEEMSKEVCLKMGWPLCCPRSLYKWLLQIDC
ncbi:hypothetical protein ACH5RR_036328 [Cinchona calisaya]|uniref:H15 domain-containing protein n=1 Tax=Cinchona calisaya TaxID=153742 RepID=A0ABD2Y6H0_9GENT